jgi:hypothetical protein
MFEGLITAVRYNLGWSKRERVDNEDKYEVRGNCTRMKKIEVA